MSSVFKRGLSYLGLVEDDEDYRDEGLPESWHGAEAHLPEVPVPLERASAPAVTLLTPYDVAAVEPRRTVTVESVSPTAFADAQAVADRFKAGDPVLVNLQQAGRDLTRRMIDFCSGLTYALQGTMERVAEGIFLISPPDVAPPAFELPADDGEYHEHDVVHEDVRRLA